MGSSKIIMLSGVYLILGMYSISFNNYDGASFDLAAKTASAVQAEQIARTGISLALANMANRANSASATTINAAVMNGNVTCTVPVFNSTTQYLISSTAVFNGKSLTVKAVFVFHNNRWKVNQIYIPPTA
jgi:hypothetical protein